MAVAYTWRKTVASARQLTPKRVKICLPAATAESVAYSRTGPNRPAANALGELCHAESFESAVLFAPALRCRRRGACDKSGRRGGAAVRSV